MITNTLAKIFGSANDRKVKQLHNTVAEINAFEPKTSALTDEQLTEKTNEFRKQLSEDKTLNDILPEAFAVVRETAKRKLGQRHYDVQLMGGIVLHQGKISEMKTGEGKTLTATLPLYLNALAGKGAHLVTVNDYLAKRDAEWMGPIFEHLGLTVGVLQNSMGDQERKDTYNCDILYATNNELGFDYLRDNMKFRLEDYVQRDPSYAIVDEVDSILIDEARTPLIISGPANESSELYHRTNEIIAKLKKGEDYEVDEKARSVQMSEAGNDKVESALKIESLYVPENIHLLHHITQALKAHGLFRRDVDYVVNEDQVLIVDEFTGRILPGRRYSDGLHQALEAKEGVTVERESQTLASITLQNYFRLYPTLAGMTGTAQTESEEFFKIYKLDVVAIPTNKALIRDDKNDLIFLSQNAKFKFILEDMIERHKKGQPVLIGTVAVETSEMLSRYLGSNNIKHEILNAKNHSREAEIIEHAGEPGKITIATNMAGRGTDIKLTAESVEAGGLYILGTERHESRRIDNQLRGRSGRQGDPGESRFYISLEDDLIRVFAGDTLKDRMLTWAKMKEDDVIEDKMISRVIENAQQKVEKNNFEIRKNLIEYDDVLNQHRTVIYRYRREILESDQEIYKIVRDFISETVEDAVAENSNGKKITPEQAAKVLKLVTQISTLPESEFINAKINTTNPETFRKDLINFLLEKYSLFRGQQDEERIKEAEKWVALESMDQAWKQHMLNIDNLKEGIGLRSWGQKNPLIEYKREAFIMFKDMMRSVRYDIIHHIFHLNLANFNKDALEAERQRELDKLSLQSGKAEEAKPVQREEPKVGRNDDCTCGSGKKYKKCCGK
jgi:preprotein translocase subunit SecA